MVAHPKIVILESVGGILQDFKKPELKRMYTNPLGFLLRGDSRLEGLFGHKEFFDHALTRLKNFTVTFFDLAAGVFGLPVRRSRVFIVLVRNDILAAAGADMDMPARIANFFKQRPLAKGTVDAFTVPKESAMDLLQPRKRRRPTTSLNKEQEHAFHRWRISKGLPTCPRETKIFSSTAPRCLIERLSAKQIAVADASFSEAKLTFGYIPEDLVVHLDVGITRRPWRVGSVFSPSSNSKIYDHRLRDIMSSATLFNILGWDCRENPLVIPLSTSGNCLRRLIGGIIAVQPIGAVFLAVLLSFLPGLKKARRKIPFALRDPQQGKAARAPRGSD